jgi:hypothetical protein
MQRLISGLLLLLVVSSSAHAALLSRAGGQAFYDTELDVTWVADANLARTTGYDFDGALTWAGSQAWIASLNSSVYLGTSDWRLPGLVDTGTPGCNFANSGTDCGYNVETKVSGVVKSELAHLFYETLGNSARYDATGAPTGCGLLCLTNVGPFSNVQTWLYWTGTTYAPDAGYAWDIDFEDGLQYFEVKTTANRFSWAVRSGDIAVVPVPAAAWFMASGLGLLGLIRRKTAA